MRFTVLRAWLAAMLLAGCGSIPQLPDGRLFRNHHHAEQPLVAGNRVQLLRDGMETFPAMFRAIGEARDHINLEFYIVQDVRLPGTRGASLFALLAEKLRQGVQVNIIYDSVGSAFTPGAEFDALRRLGARIVSFNPASPFALRRFWAANARDHRKILVVDGRIGFTGGVNLDRAYENPCGYNTPPASNADDACWRDTSIRIEGPAVAALQRLFLETWAQQRGPALPGGHWFPATGQRGPVPMAVLGSAPHDGPPHYYLALMDAVQGAERRIWLSTGYFVPPHQQRRALAHAARRGVDVRLVLPSLSDSAMALDAGRAAYGDLLEAGVRIFEMRGMVLHSKLATVDGSWSAIGSSNLDHRSVALNNEVDAVLQGADMAAEVERVLAADMALAQEVTLQEHRRRSLGDRLRELYARFWIDQL